MSSTYCDLKAVFYVLKSYANSLRHQRLKVFVDNMGASRVLMVGSSKPYLQQIAVDIFSICLSFDISLDLQWLPREENTWPIYSDNNWLSSSTFDRRCG